MTQGRRSKKLPSESNKEDLLIRRRKEEKIATTQKIFLATLHPSSFGRHARMLFLQRLLSQLLSIYIDSLLCCFARGGGLATLANPCSAGFAGVGSHPSNAAKIEPKQSNALLCLGSLAPHAKQSDARNV